MYAQEWDCRVIWLLFKGISILFFIVAILTYTPTNSVGGFPSLHILSAFLFVDFFEDSHSDQTGEGISHCSSDLHFSNN